MLSDAMIMARVGDRLRSSRLKQNITQQDLAKDAGVSLSSLKNLAAKARQRKRASGGKNLNKAKEDLEW